MNGPRGLLAGLVLTFLFRTPLSAAEPRSACRAAPVTASGEVLDTATSHASLSRTLPRSLSAGEEGDDSDALAWGLVCGGELPGVLRLLSERPDGVPLDTLEPLAVLQSPCPPAAPEGSSCGRTPAVRAVVDDADRLHPAARHVSVLAEVGGRLVLSQGSIPLAAIPVGGPRQTAVGPIERLRATLRVHIVRARPGGEPPLGGTDRAAVERVRREVHAASMLWGQCGIHFGPPLEAEIRLVDPPEPHLVAIGCDLGLPASGGTVAFLADGRPVRVRVQAGSTPEVVAEAVAVALTRAGFLPVLSPNTRILPGALRSVDVRVKRRDGRPARVLPEAGSLLTTDATLGVCLGEVQLANGLSHFDDLDAAAGTLEERSLVRAFADGDPRTIDVFIIPSFASTGRIGESFIDEPGTSMRNLVLVDRAGIRASSRSYALPHELGHVLLDLPGHPDDFGVDRPWALMDADSTDGSIFGPRRLSLEDCERAVRQSGPTARVPLLTPWPLPRKR